MPTLKVTKDRFEEVLAELKTLTKAEVYVGVPADDATRQMAEGEKEPVNNALIGYINERGSPANNIPARPHLVPGIEAVSDRITALLKKGVVQTLDGKHDAAGKALMSAGQVAASAVRAKITAGLMPAPAAATLAARQRKGFRGTKPLIVTGAYLRAITFVLRPKSANNAQR